nr:MAG TPA: hypothetical protein [Caudoviricetes sp.]
MKQLRTYLLHLVLPLLLHLILQLLILLVMIGVPE